MKPEVLSPDQIKAGSYLDEQPSGGPVAEMLSPDQIKGGQYLDDAATGASPPAKPSWAESLGRGALQGATLGFSDELAGVIESVVTDKTYEQARDESRSKNKAAQEAHPWLYGGGELAGGAATALVPGLGAAGGLGKAVATGAAAGLGSSDADLTKGEFGKAAVDTAVGGAAGLAAHGAGKAIGGLVGGAEERADKRLLSSVGDRANKSVRDKMAGDAANVLEVVKAKGLDQVAKDPVALQAASKAAKAETGKAIGEAFRVIDEETGTMGAPVRDVLKALKGVRAQYRDNPVTAELGDSMNKLIVQTQKRFGKGGQVPLRALNDMVTSLENKGFAGMAEPGTRKELQKRAAMALEDVLQKRFAAVTESAANRAGSATAERLGLDVEGKAAAAIAKLPQLNKEYRALIQIERAATQRAKLVPFSPTGLRSIMGENPTALGMARSAARAAVTPADDALARVTALAKAGHPGALKLLQSGFGAGQRAATVAPGALPAAAMASLGPPPDDQAVAEGP